MPDSLLPDLRVIHIGRCSVERDFNRFLWGVYCPGMDHIWCERERDAIALAETLSATPHLTLMQRKEAA